MMRRKFIAVDSEKCTGCGICELVCSSEKNDVFNPLLSRIHVVRMGSTIATSVACLLCEDPACVRSCPRKALSVSEKTRTILVNKDKCDGCGWCIEACEFGAVDMDFNKKIVTICDLCDMKPKCVDYCPPRALSLATTDQISQKKRIESIAKLFSIKNRKDGS